MITKKTKKATPKKKVAPKKKVTKKTKKVAPKKKIVTKKTVKHELAITVQTQTSAPIDVTKAIEPIKEKGKYMLVPSAFGENQVMHMLQKTPAHHIHKRPGKGGKEFDYVTGVYMKKVLNYVFGWMWSFDILSTEEKYGQVVIQGKLTIHKKDGSILMWKTDVGNADIKFLKGTKTPLDYGNDVKAATTDCIKRCAAQFGFASDVYGKSEFKDIGANIQSDVQTQSTDGGIKCVGFEKGGCPGGITLTVEQAEYSKKIYKKILCVTCQASLKAKKK